MSKKIEVELDQDSEKILEKVSPVMKNAAIIIGLKLLANNSMYSAYISDNVPDEVKASVVVDDITNNDTSVKQPDPVNQPEEKVVVDKPKTTWDSF
ncbi:hypothetical protein [Yersinia phage vB_Yru_GN1]|uniref:Uncharacterized protein n=1 Tax=Yersinia phage vB_Yru_GN1 TaxID=3074381 RepID=A0AA86MA89_9CAUD|nr:hypothetical protein [Yersinia phage vB_Yru_GN1]